MIASRREGGRAPPARRRICALVMGPLLAVGFATACRTTSGAPAGSPLEPLSHAASVVPDEADRAAAALARAALLSDREEAVRALAQLEVLDASRREAGERPTGLVPVGLDLIHASLEDDRAYREAARALLERKDLDPALRARVEATVKDDPLRLAAARIWDSRVASFGRIFNAIVEPLGTSLLTGVMAAPMKLASSLVTLVLKTLSTESFDFRERQALAHWKEFLRENPSAEEAASIRARVERAQAEWNRNHRSRHLRSARRALRKGNYGLAKLLAERVLALAPGDRSATRILERAGARAAALRAKRDGSLAAPETTSDEIAAARPLAVALLLPDSDLLGEARALLDAAPEGPVADEAQFAIAVAYRESGSEWAMWKALDRSAGVERSNMARHAAALSHRPRQNPYRAFSASRRRDFVRRVAWILFGPYANGFPERRIPAPLQWLLETPALAQSLMGAPMRLIQYPWSKPLPIGRGTAFAANTYLRRYPNGEHSDEVRDWLEDFEGQRGNWLGALRVAQDRPSPDPEEFSELEEKAATQALEMAQKQTRADLRGVLLRSVARDFPKTPAGDEAGHLARAEVENAARQRIRVSRGFLKENPAVGGPHGLGLRPQLLDARLENGELHPEGVTLLGGRAIEVALVAASGDEDDPANRVRKTISNERLGRFVSQLEATALRNELVDSAYETAPDALRDYYFEYARLGIADRQPKNAAARSDFSYLGLRERYGLMRSREPLLPIDLVFQASPYDWSLGAFPRIREPKKTPDWFLFE